MTRQQYVQEQLHKRYEEWFRKEAKNMPPMTKFMKDALHGFGKLANLQGASDSVDIMRELESPEAGMFLD